MTIGHARLGRGTLSMLVVFGLLFAGLAIIGSSASTLATVPSAANSLNAPPVQSAAGATCGQVPVPLASAGSYAVLASSTVTNTGATAITGDLGLFPGTSVTGFPPGKITGHENVTTPPAKWAMANLTIAYNNASGRSNCPVTVAGNIGGQTLTPGLYKSTSSLAISSGDLTLSGGRNPNAVFIFQVASALTTTSGRKVILSDGAQAGNVFWQVGSSVTLGTTSVMQGTVMAHDSVSMLTGSTLNGRAFAATGEVSLAGSTIVVPSTAPASSYAVTFTASGLAAGTSWSVTLGGVQTSSTTTTVAFSVVSGTYSYAVGVAGYIATPSSGSITVSGAATSQAVAFKAAAPGTFTVSFNESGLTAGTSWAVTLNGVQATSSTTTIAFTMASGTYAYTIGIVTNFTSTPSTGSVTVNGAAVGQAITFTSQGSSTSSSGGLSTVDWLVIAGVVAVGAIAGGAIALSRRHKV